MPIKSYIAAINQTIIMKTFKDIYRFPLHKVEPISFVMDKSGNFVFQFEIDDEDKEKLILDIINGNSDKVTGKKYVHDNGLITEDGEPIILIRGWGNLTGTGSHNLSGEEAANIQDTFAEFIVNKLNTF